MSAPSFRVLFDGFSKFFMLVSKIVYITVMQVYPKYWRLELIILSQLKAIRPTPLIMNL